MIKLHIWERYSLTGHASIETDNYYASFHPLNCSRLQLLKETCAIPVASRWAKDINDDIYGDDSKGREPYGRPIRSIAVKGLNERAIEDYMVNGHMDEDFSTYELYLRNCSTLSANLIGIGQGMDNNGHVNLSNILSKLSRQNWSSITHPFSDKHENSARFAELAFELLERVATASFHLKQRPVNERSYRTFLKLFPAMDITKRSIVWTPGDVLYLAQQINEEI